MKFWNKKNTLKISEEKIKEMIEKCPQTVNITTLDAINEILKAVDKWRRKKPDGEVVENLMQSIFYLLATCSKLDHKLVLDEVLEQIIKSKAGFKFEGEAEDNVWSYLLFVGPAPIEYSKESQLHLAA